MKFRVRWIGDCGRIYHKLFNKKKEARMYLELLISSRTPCAWVEQVARLEGQFSGVTWKEMTLKSLYSLTQQAKHAFSVLLIASFLFSACGGEDDYLYMNETDLQALEAANICQVLRGDGSNPTPHCDADDMP